MIDNPRILGESVLLIAAEFDWWTDTDSVPARDRLDVLGLDATGRLVVVELKRGTAYRDVHHQAITYAALMSRFGLDTLAQAHRDFLAGRGQALDLDACRQRLLEHVDGDWSPELLQRPRQVIIAADFPKQVTHTVVWLSEMNLDTDLVQVGCGGSKGPSSPGFTGEYRQYTGQARVHGTGEERPLTPAAMRPQQLDRRRRRLPNLIPRCLARPVERRRSRRRRRRSRRGCPA
ncbi:hypothetical protein [Streptomyces sp. TRM64462]|uniref:hypothetical protein n=1 Tax=Streptomyces sp. TRM64462 TaxID=2741726 RepID=UPI0020C778A5|nr:hypothetical protein [Streptomyces sp. TRM64462]